jgi:MinD superfamily P-loop ATPase
MRWAEVNWELCQGCKKCTARMVCRTRALMRLEGENVMFVETQRCNACGNCLENCQFSAIRIYDSTGSTNNLTSV